MYITWLIFSTFTHITWLVLLSRVLVLVVGATMSGFQGCSPWLLTPFPHSYSSSTRTFYLTWGHSVTSQIIQTSDKLDHPRLIRYKTSFVSLVYMCKTFVFQFWKSHSLHFVKTLTMPLLTINNSFKINKATKNNLCFP